MAGKGKLAQRGDIVDGIATLLGPGVFIANQHLVFRHLDGDYLRGFLVDRTSSQDGFTIYAFTQAWFSVAESFHLSWSFRLKRGRSFSGELPDILREIAEELDGDKGIRRVVNAEGRDSPYLDTRVMRAGHPHEPVALRAEAAAMRALGGDHAWALLTLRQLETEMQLLDRPIDLWRKKMVSDLVRSLYEHRCVRSVLDPMAAAGRERLTIKRVGKQTTAHSL